MCTGLLTVTNEMIYPSLLEHISRFLSFVLDTSTLNIQIEYFDWFSFIVSGKNLPGVAALSDA